MQETITSESLFCDYYAQWVRTYKEGAIRDAVSYTHLTLPTN